MDIRPIKTENDYEATLARIEEIFFAKSNTPEGDELEVLSTLVSAYEDAHFKIEAPDPIAAIEHMMEAKGMDPHDLIQFLGTRSRVSEVLNKKRALSITMIRKLTTGLHIPAKVLIPEYDLTT